MGVQYRWDLALLLVVSIQLAVIQAAQATERIYQWTDEDGKVNFSDKPPPGQEALEVAVEPGPSPEEIAAARQQAETVQRDADQRAADRARRAEESLGVDEDFPAVAAPEAPAEPEADEESRYSDYPVQPAQPAQPARPVHPSQLPATSPRPRPRARPG
jgi:hypothetical protein